MNDTKFKSGFVTVLLLGIILPVAGSVFVHMVLPGRNWIQVPLHSAVEALGALAALSLAVFSLLLWKYRKEYAPSIWIACALIGMGILDGFHSSVSPGNSFVWLRSTATLIGGFLFALVWLPERIARSRAADALPALVAVTAGIFGTLSIVFSDALPAMISQGDFTSTAEAVNILGGLFFLLAAIHFIVRYRINGSFDDILFANLTLLFGFSGLLFQFSSPWEANWWFWHLLRLTAYLVALWYVFTAYQSTMEDLKQEVAERRKMEEKLRQHVGEVMEAVNVLASSASEMFTATQQLASTASQTATAVSQTSATAEELKQTARLSSEKAKHVSESAQKAAQVAQQGTTAVAENMEAINRIKGQAELVAESIVKLSEQTQTIGDITTTVNDLTEQSNLLAVNAAIEAAKAGEQGKGFSVVAQEIKSLAVQSKQATAQVRAILSEAQKATGATAMATEQVSKAVEAGVKQATEAGKSIRNLSDTIVEASNAATQVASSSQQQLVGIDQIASAMENIKQATQQNSAGIKQVEKAADDLNVLGQKLKAMAEESKV